MRPPVPRDMTYTNLFVFFGVLLWAMPFMRLKRINSIFGLTQFPHSADWAAFRLTCSREWSQAFLFVSVTTMQSMKWFQNYYYSGYHSISLHCGADGNTGIGTSQICAYYRLLLFYCVLFWVPWCDINSHHEYRFCKKGTTSRTCRGSGELSCDDLAHGYRFDHNLDRNDQRA